MKTPTVLLSLAIAGCSQIAPWAVSYQHWTSYDRKGVSIAQGDYECDEKADEATSNIGDFANRVLSFNRLKSECLRQRGY